MARIPKHTRGPFFTATLALCLCTIASEEVQPSPRRVSLWVGQWHPSAEHRTASRLPGPSQSTRSGGLMGAWTYSGGVGERVALSGSVGGLLADIGTAAGPAGISSTMVMLSSFLGGIRYDLTGPASPFRPFLTAMVGPTFGFSMRTDIGLQNATGTPIHQPSMGASFGGRLGAGLDMGLGDRLSIGLLAGYHRMKRFPDFLGGRRDFSGLEVGVTLGWRGKQ